MKLCLSGVATQTTHVVSRVGWPRAVSSANMLKNLFAWLRPSAGLCLLAALTDHSFTHVHSFQWLAAWLSG